MWSHGKLHTVTLRWSTTKSYSLSFYINFYLWLLHYPHRIICIYAPGESCRNFGSEQGRSQRGCHFSDGVLRVHCLLHTVQCPTYCRHEHPNMVLRFLRSSDQNIKETFIVVQEKHVSVYSYCVKLNLYAKMFGMKSCLHTNRILAALMSTRTWFYNLCAVLM